MKQIFRKTLSLVLALVLLSSLTLPAFASEALGEDLKQQETLLHRETQLFTNVFWSTAYSDLRTEHFITYTPNGRVTPIVTSGTVLREQSTVSEAAKRAEEVLKANRTLLDQLAEALLKNETLEEKELAPILKGAKLPTSAKLH